MKTVSLDLFDYSENITPADKGQSINLAIRELYQEPKQAAVIPVLALMPGALVPAYYHNFHNEWYQNLNETEKKNATA